MPELQIVELNALKKVPAKNRKPKKNSLLTYTDFYRFNFLMKLLKIRAERSQSDFKKSPILQQSLLKRTHSYSSDSKSRFLMIFQNRNSVYSS